MAYMHPTTEHNTTNTLLKWPGIGKTETIETALYALLHSLIQNCECSPPYYWTTPHILFAWILYSTSVCSVYGAYLSSHFSVYFVLYWWTAVWCMAYCECNWLSPLFLNFRSMDIRECAFSQATKIVLPSKRIAFEFADNFKEIFTWEHINNLISAPWQGKVATLTEITPQYSI